jgi:hypothetical protein
MIYYILLFLVQLSGLTIIILIIIIPSLRCFVEIKVCLIQFRRVAWVYVSAYISKACDVLNWRIGESGMTQNKS